MSGPEPVGPPREERSLEESVRRAQAGDRHALEEVVGAIQDRVYGLALRMLWHPEDARDAAQEVLIRVVTHLGTFRGESAFTTWVYRVACNYLKSARHSRLETMELTWERFGADLDESGVEPPTREARSPDHVLLLEEVKIGCTHGMLLCLDRDHRLAYILGEILELDGTEAAAILEADPATYRKRLERARRDVVAFTRAKCGLVEATNTCRCRRRVQRAVELGRVDPGRPLFARDAERARRFPAVLEEIRRLESLRRAAALYRSHGDFRSPEDFAEGFRAILARRGFGDAPPDSR